MYSEDSNQSGHPQSDQSLSFLPDETLDPWLPTERPWEDSDQTVGICRLISVFKGHTCVPVFIFLEMTLGCLYDAYSLKQKKKNRNRGSYMSAHVLLNLLNELGKRDEMRSLSSILSLFRNEFNNSIIQEHEC